MHHLRSKLDNSVNKLKELLIKMFDETKNQHQAVLAMFKNNDYKQADVIINEDNNINQSLVVILKKSAWLIIREQPVAVDLRKIISYPSIAKDIERIADYAKNFANFQKNNNPSKELVLPIIQLLEKTLIMFDSVKLAILTERTDEIIPVYWAHLKIKEFYEQKVNSLILNFATIKNKEKETASLFAFQQLKYGERLSDHLINICEAIIYIIEGKIVEISDWIVRRNK